MADAARKLSEEAPRTSASGVRNAQALPRTAANDALIGNSDAAKAVRKKVYPDATRNAAVFTTSQTTSDTFTDEYAKKGLQPTGIGMAEKKKDEAANDAVVTGERAPDQTRGAEVRYRSLPPRATHTKTTTTKINLTSKEHKVSLLTRAKATRASIMVLSIGLGLLPFLVFLALAAMTFFGAAMALEAAKQAYADAAASNGVIEVFDQIVKTAGKVINSGLDVLNRIGVEALGLDVGQLISDFTDTYIVGPSDAFIAFHSIFFAVSICMLVTFAIIYLVHLLRPLSGEKMGLKIGMFILALVGYSMPLVGLLPWFLPWAYVVWKYPK